jgi:hypothetical protein
VKEFLLILLFIGSFWIHHQWYVVWGWICLVLSVFFLIIQGYFLLNLAYIWNDNLIEAIDDKDGTCYAKFLLFCYTSVNTIGSIVWLVFQWIWFNGCGLGMFQCGVTTFFCVFFLVAAITVECEVKLFREEANMFVCSLAIAYITYLNWSALASNPDETCNPFTESTANTVWQIITGTAVTACTIISIATASTTTAKSAGEKKASFGNEIIAENVDEEAKAADEEDVKAAIFPVTLATLIFQGVMLFASCYYAMLFTNWGSVTIEGDSENIFDASSAPLWIKVIC